MQFFETKKHEISPLKKAMVFMECVVNNLLVGIKASRWKMDLDTQCTLL